MGTQPVLIMADASGIGREIVPRFAERSAARPLASSTCPDRATCEDAGDQNDLENSSDRVRLCEAFAG